MSSYGMRNIFKIKHLKQIECIYFMKKHIFLASWDAIPGTSQWQFKQQRLLAFLEDRGISLQC